MVVEPDGTLAVAVIRRAHTASPLGGVELWRKGRLVGGFIVPARLIAGGLGMSPNRRYLVAYGDHRSLATYFDRRGNPVRSVPLS
jgi:hypothetical protein